MAVVILFISSLLPASLASRVSFVPKSLMQLALTPITTVLHGFSTSMRPSNTLPIAGINSYEQLQAEYSEATMLIRQQQLEMERLEQENRQLRNFYDLHGNNEGIMVMSARVAGVSEPPNPMITISKGTNHQLASDNAVIYNGNLVGMIKVITPLTAEVQLISNQSVQLPVVFLPPIANSDSATSYKEYDLNLNTDDNGKTFYVQVDPNSPIRVGDFAHLLDKNNYWPSEAKGAIVGQVVDIIEDPSQPYLLNRVIIQPNIELTRLRNVDVLIPRNQN